MMATEQRYLLVLAYERYNRETSNIDRDRDRDMSDLRRPNSCSLADRYLQSVDTFLAIDTFCLIKTTSLLFQENKRSSRQSRTALVAFKTRAVNLFFISHPAENSFVTLLT